MPTSRGTGASSLGCGSSSGSGCWRRCPSSTRRHRPRRPPGRCGDHAGPLAVGTSRTAGAPAGRDPRGCVGPDHADGGAREALSRGACDRRTKPRAVAQPLARGAGARGRELPSLEVHVGRGAAGREGELQALQDAPARREGADPARLPALERAAGRAAARATEGLRALPAAPPGAARAHFEDIPPVGNDVARGAGACHEELRALEEHEPRGACPQTQRARGARALAPHAPGGAGTAPAAVSQPAAASRPGAAEVTWLALVLLTLGALTGCGAPAFGAGAAPPTGAAPADALRVAPPLAEARRILHVLNRVGFGPRPGDVERVRAVGLEAWIDRQLHPETIDDRATERALAELASIRLSIPEALREYPRPDPGLREKVQNGEMTRAEMMETYPLEKRPFRIAAELQAAKTLRAVESERQLQEVMVDFWFNHFNVFAEKGDVRWYVAAYERDVIRPNALGRRSEERRVG